MMLWGCQVAAQGSDLLYLFPNKDVYETGEDMWFKVWLFDQESLSLSDKSKTLYLRMYAPTDTVVWDEIYPIKGGCCDGHIYICDKWASGEYRVEGYTKSSFLSDSITPIYPRKILIVDRIAAIDSLTHSLNAIDSIKTLKDFRFGMYPEGGDLVYGITSKVAFKATNGRGLPVDVEGYLTDNGQQFSHFRSLHDGMGFFILCPQEGHTYQAVLSDGQAFALPNPQHTGLTLSVIKQDTTAVRCLIMQPKGTADQHIKLTAKMRGVLCCEAQGTITDSLLINMPMKHLSTQSIVEMTLFNGENRPVCERLVYVNPQKSLHISIKTDESSYHRRSEGKLSIHVTDEAGRPVQTELCVSLFDKWYQSDRTRETMLSHCYLSSQIRGNIHNPMYYFDKRNKDRLRALDLLLLTQGWRRYTKPSRGCEILTDGIRGKVFFKKKMNNGTEGMQAIQVSGYDAKTKLMWTDSLGYFDFSPEILEPLRGGYVYAKPLSATELKPYIEFFPTSPHIADIRKTKPIYELLYKNERPKDIEDTDIASGLGTHTLQGITVTAKKRRAFTDKMTGQLDSIMSLKFSSGWVCIHKGGDTYLNDYVDGWSHHPWATQYNVRDLSLERIETPKKGQHYQIIKYEHISGDYWELKNIAHTTYQGPIFTEKDLLEMNHITRVKGYYGEREFYQPDKVELLTDIPDARNALLWLPSVVTDSDGKAEIPFLTSDVTGQFVGIIEGTDGCGTLGSKDFEINIKKYAY